MPKLLSSTVLLLAALALLPTRRARADEPLTSADTDKSGWLDKAEFDTAVGAAFDRLDADKSGTLTQAELGDHISKASFAAADADHNGTLTKEEYLAAADKEFAAVDTNHDGKIKAKELKTKKGRALKKLFE